MGKRDRALRGRAEIAYWNFGRKKKLAAAAAKNRPHIKRPRNRPGAVLYGILAQPPQILPPQADLAEGAGVQQAGERAVALVD